MAKYNRVCNTVNSPHATNAPFISTSRKSAIQSLQNLYTSHWLKQIPTERKMRTYITLKTHFQKEDYLNLTDRHLRTAMTRLRISAHNLLIERGRYIRPPLAVEERTCPVCANGQVEDELHFMTQCTKYESDRNKLYSDITNICPNFEYLSPKEKFTYMLTADGSIVRHVAKFIGKNLPWTCVGVSCQPVQLPICSVVHCSVY